MKRLHIARIVKLEPKLRFAVPILFRRISIEKSPADRSPPG
jgi:hypothetical protein